jgi:hypothetical protein
MNHVSEWKTPELVIHGAKDYRLVDGQGIGKLPALVFVMYPLIYAGTAAFTALQ